MLRLSNMDRLHSQRIQGIIFGACLLSLACPYLPASVEAASPPPGPHRRGPLRVVFGHQGLFHRGYEGLRSHIPNRELHEWATLPNVLTASRVPAVVGAIGAAATGHHDWALGLYLAAMATDAADGAIARAWKSTSTWGARWDPHIDKFAVVAPAAYVAAVDGFASGSWAMGGVWSAMALATAGRDVFVTRMRNRRSDGMPADPLGKRKTIFQMTAMPLALAPEAVSNLFEAVSRGALTVPETAFQWGAAALFAISVNYGLRSWANYHQAFEQLAGQPALKDVYGPFAGIARRLLGAKN